MKPTLPIYVLDACSMFTCFKPLTSYLSYRHLVAQPVFVNWSVCQRFPLWNLNNSKMVTIFATKIKGWTEIMGKIKRKINKKPENNVVDQNGKRPAPYQNKYEH